MTSNRARGTRIVLSVPLFHETLDAPAGFLGMNKSLCLAMSLVLSISLVPELHGQSRERHGDLSRGDSSRGGSGRSSFLTRLDRNDNGMLDPDEQQGPAKFLLKRLESTDKNIVPGRPIPIKTLTAAFAKMRGQRTEGDRDGRRSRDERWRDRPESSAGDKALESEALVPGFGNPTESEMLMGFGSAAELMIADVTDVDRREASKRLRHFDKDKDGFLTKAELTHNFAGNPMDFDRNRDGKLSLDELALRYARRREGKEQAARNHDGQSSATKRSTSSRESEVSDLFGGRKSYRVVDARSAPEGVPGFFTERDQNEDGQISMAEFTDEWNDDELQRFYESDFNQDGIITVEEAIRSVEEGPAEHESTSSRAPQMQSNPSSTSSKFVDPKYLSVAKRIIARRDKNKDGALTVSEWKTMLMSPVEADADKDGRITAVEYAQWMLARESSR